MRRLLPPRWLGLALYLALAAGFVWWLGAQPLMIGQMELPAPQRRVVAGLLVVACSLAGLWLLLPLHLLLRRLGWSRRPSLFDHRALRWATLLSLGLGLALYAYGRFGEARRLTTVTVTLTRERAPAATAARGSLLLEGNTGATATAPSPAHTPDRATPGRDALRLAVLSDLHIDGPRRPFSDLAAAVNASRPDAILVLGDLLNRPAGLAALRGQLAAMRAPLGKYAVRGNWDVWYWAHLPLLEDTGFAWLDDRAVRLEARGRVLHLAGLTYRDDEIAAGPASWCAGTTGGSQLERRARRLAASLPVDGAWRVFAYHTPDLAAAVASHVDLYLAGHTHGGQVHLPGYGALVTLSVYGKRFERGLAPLCPGTRIAARQAEGPAAGLAAEAWLYTNPGVGVEPAVPLRLGVVPELTLIDLD